MSRLKAYKVDLLIVAGMLILPLLLFGPVTIGAKTMLPLDNLYQWQPWQTAAEILGIDYPQNGLLSDLILENYAWKQFIINNVREGQIPLWNPNNFAGTPFLATGQHSAYYPFSLLFLLIPLAKAYGWYTVSQLWLAGILTYLFARTLGQRRSSSAVAGLIYQGSGFLLVSSAVFPMILGAAVWLPLLLTCIEKIIGYSERSQGAGKSLPWASLGAITLGTQILAGHIEITYYTLLVMAFYSLWRLATIAFRLIRNQQASEKPDWLMQLLKPAAWLGGFVVVGLMLGAIQLIPFIEVGQANFREGSATFEQVKGWGFPPRRILTLAMPDFYGNPADHSYFDVFVGESVSFSTNYYGEVNPHGPYTSDWGIKNYVEGGIYLGVLTLFLAGFGVWSAVRQFPKRRSHIGFFSVLSLLSLSFIFGTSLYAILYYGLPGLNQLHSPFRWAFPFSLCIAVLAGYGIDFLVAKREESVASQDDEPAQPVTDGSGARPTLSRFSLPKTAGMLALFSALLIFAALIVTRAFYQDFEPAFESLFLGLERAPDAFPSTTAFYSHLFRQAILLALFLLLSGVVLWFSQRRSGSIGRRFWALLVLFVIGLDLLVAGFGFNSAVDPVLLEREPELIEWLKSQPGYWRLTTFSPHGDKPLNANTPWSYGLQDIRGYDSIILKQYSEYMASIEPQNELQFNRIQPLVNWQSINSPLLDLLGVRYIVSSESLELAKLSRVWEGEGLNVYENLAAVPRAYTIAANTTVLTDDPLEAMSSLDPRQYTVVERSEWPLDLVSDAVPGIVRTATIKDYTNIEVVVRADVDEPSWLILNDTHFQGWEAYVRSLASERGVESAEISQQIIRVNGNFRGILLDPGSWEVRFRYSPLSFKLGGLTSFMGIIVILFALAIWTWRRIYRPQGPLTDTSSIAKNSLAPMGLNLFNKAIDFVFAAFYLRILGPSDAGSYATAIVIAGWFEIVSNWGLNTLIIREVSRDKSQASRYLLNTSVLRLGTALLGSLPIAIYLLMVGLSESSLDSETTIAIILLMIGMIFSGMGQGLAGLFYAFETAEVPAAITTVSTILKVGFGVTVLLLGYSFVGLAGVSIVVNFITLLILIIGAFRQFRLRGPWFVDFSLQRRMFVLSYPLMLNHLLAVIFFQIDVPLMRQINGDEAVGWYNSAYKWVNAFNIIPAFFTFALFPVISRQVKTALPAARRTFRLSIKLMLLLSLPLAALTTLMAPVMIGVLGGRQFLPDGAIALQLIIWSIPFGWMNSVTNYVLISLGREKRLTLAFIIGVGFNLITNLLLLPIFGYVAASILTIFSELVLLSIFIIFLKSAMPAVGWLNIIKRPLAATAMMIWAIVLGSQIHLVIGLASGLLVYPIALWIFRVLEHDERQILGSLIPEGLRQRWPLTILTESDTRV